MAERDLAVVHLVRRANGEEPFERFLRSYRAHPAGVAHELVLLFKGFDSDGELAPYRELAGDATSRSLRIGDEGYDVSAYLDAARRLDATRLCFVNSFSEILADGWLEPLARALDADGTGLAGATGSWASQLSHIRYDLHLGGIYARLYPDRGRTQERLRELAGVDGAGEESLPTEVLRKLGVARAMLRRCLSFEQFPAHHVRTNAFIVARDVLARVRSGPQRDKIDAFRLESGRRSLTRQVEAIGLRAVVVGRDGRAYEQRDWAESRTFWRCDQENLLVADNQTAAYQKGDRELREILSHFAWGAAGDAGAR